MVQTSGLLGRGRLNASEMDMIYTRCKGPSRKINWRNFQTRAIPQLAQACYGNAGGGNQQKVVRAIISRAPGLNTNLQMSKAGVVNRLTDTRGYTGAHKARFDNTGRGRGLAGRSDRAKNTGYVQGYKNQNTWGRRY